jgi:hypothetical protein
MTPEGKIKRGIKAVLDRYRPHVYTYMPVPGGYGRRTLDYIGFCCGLGFAIEAKRIGGKPTSMQQTTISEIEQSGARVFVINSYDRIVELEQWITTVVDNRSV